MKKVIISESDIRKLVASVIENLMESKTNEIKTLATKSNVTICSLEDFWEICKSLNVNDSNVEKVAGQYCFIEVGDSYNRVKAELPLRNDDDIDDYYANKQYFFKQNHKNVLKLEFDDNQKFDNKMPKGDGFDGKTPATAVKLSPGENRFGKSMTFYYQGGKDFTNEMANELKTFVDNNLTFGENVKFIVHCHQGKSRSGAIGCYIANKINQFTDDFLGEYDLDDEKSQINIGMSTKGQPKYPHKNVMSKMGEVEGWSKAKDDTNKQWFYDRLINHPKTGYAARKALKEDAYIGSQDSKHKTLQINYEKGKAWGKRLKNAGNDFLRTDKMDNTSGADTYEVPLKGGIMSYNITSINGTGVMHFFKNYFDNKKKTNVTLKDKMGHEEEYELRMKEQEFNDFLNTFSAKVNAVVNYHIGKIKQKNPTAKFRGVAIYPVPSSSNFNIEMAKELKEKMVPIGGFKKGITVINPEIFNKDLANLRLDKTFIKKNQEYYDSIAYTKKKEGVSATSNQMLDTALSKFQAFNDAKEYIEKLSDIAEEIIALRNRRNAIKVETYEEKLAKLYMDYYNTYQAVLELGEYYNYETGKISHQKDEKLLSAIKYSKGPSIKSRSKDTWETVEPYLKGMKDINGKPFKQIDLARWEPKKFEIKKLPDNVRMGLLGYYSKNDEKFDEEADNIKDSIFIIFDDNISGGATLSDICYLAKENGIENLIPITFGQMSKKVTLGAIPILLPTSKSGEKGVYNTNFKYKN